MELIDAKHILSEDYGLILNIKVLALCTILLSYYSYYTIIVHIIGLNIL